MAGIAREQGLRLEAVEVWIADEARVGQKNGITRRWAKRGTRPTAPQDQRYASTYIFGAVWVWLASGHTDMRRGMRGLESASCGSNRI